MAFSPNVFHQQQNWLKHPIFYPTFQHKYFEQPCLQHTDYCVSWSDCNLFLHDTILFEILRCRSLSTVTCQILCTGMTLVCTSTVSVWTHTDMQTWTRRFVFFSVAAMGHFFTEPPSFSFQKPCLCKSKFLYSMLFTSATIL